MEIVLHGELNLTVGNTTTVKLKVEQSEVTNNPNLLRMCGKEIKVTLDDEQSQLPENDDNQGRL